MNIATRHILTPAHAQILKDARELLDVYNRKFSSAASHAKKYDDIYSLAKTASVFDAGYHALNLALSYAEIHGEQESLKNG